MAKVDDNFIVELQGKQFVTYEGLLDLAHQKGLKGIKTELLQAPSKENNNTCIVKAMAIVENGEFHGIGDANPANVNSFISKHLIRMAETRAKARALRDLTNVGMTAIEELTDEGEDKSTNTSSNNKNSSTTQTNKSKTDKDKQAIADNSLATDKQLQFLYKLTEEKGFENEMAGYIKQTYNKDSSKALTKAEASRIIQMLNEIGK
jgi:hypothetical protein